MRGVCPNCERVRELTRVERTEEIEVRGELIPVELAFLRCSECGEEFRDASSSQDPLEVAYREYRRRHDMVQPESLRALRARYDLTQRQLADLLGWGVATVSRYENGALQDDAHDRMLKLAMEPVNLLKLVARISDGMSRTKREELVTELENDVKSRKHSLLSTYEERFGGYEPDSRSGYRSLDIEKVINAILYFCSGGGVLKTKLNKLLFYADFEHYRDYGVSITGLRYVHLPYGPVPDNYDHYFAALFHESKALEKEERVYHVYVGEVFTAAVKPALNVFSPSELRVLARVMERFENWSATDISDLSHREKAYADTSPNELIDYEFADSLER